MSEAPVRTRLLASGPSVTMTLDLTVSGLSSLRMVPTADWELNPYPAVGLDKETVKFSSPSTTMSPTTQTVTVWDVSPAAKFTVPYGIWPPHSEASGSLKAVTNSDM